MRRRVALLATCLLFALPSSAVADGGFTSEQLPGGITSGFWFRGHDTALGITAAGDVIAVWPDETGGSAATRTLFAVKPRGGPMGSPAPVTAAGENVPARVLTDRNGGAVIWWLSSSGGVTFRERPPGGSFGPPQDVSTPGAWSPHMVGNAAGDLAVVWHDGSSWQVAIRPAGGSFGSPAPASLPLPAAPSAWAAALSGNRELTIAWTDEAPYNEPTRVRATHRGAGGELHPVDTLSDGTLVGRIGGVASDDHGRAVVSWEETADALYTGERFMALRESGQGFGARQRVSSQSLGIRAADDGGRHVRHRCPDQLGRARKRRAVRSEAETDQVMVGRHGRRPAAGRGQSRGAHHARGPRRVLDVWAGARADPRRHRRRLVARAHRTTPGPGRGLPGGEL